MPPPLVLLVIAVIGAVAYLVIKNKGSGTPVCAPACVLPQTCVAGTCTTPAPACTTGCTLPAGCTGGTCTTPAPTTCTAAQLSKVSMPADLASRCKATTDGKWIEIPNAWVGTSSDLIYPEGSISSLDQCLQSCTSISCTNLSFNPSNNGCVLKKGAPILGGQEPNEVWSTYISVI